MCARLIFFGCCLSLATNLPADQYAFVVGVEDYIPTQFRPLKYAEDDAVAIAAQLELMGYQVVALTSRSDNPELKPIDPETILRAFDGRLKGITSEDALVVVMTGHGLQFRDDPKLSTGSRETYFCPERAKRSDKKTLLPLTKEVLRRVHDCTARRKLVLIDACRSDPDPLAQDLSGAKLIPVAPVHENPRKLPAGLSVIFSCSSDEKAWEHDELKHSVFSYFVLDYLKGNGRRDLYTGGAPDIDGLVNHVRRNTRRFVLDKITPSGQNPEWIGKGDSWKLAPVPALFTNTIGMTMRLIPSGSFMMGVSIDEAALIADTDWGPDSEDAKPPHLVRITNPFYMAATELTQGQWKQIMGDDPTEGTDFPMQVTWTSAAEFCRRLSEREAKTYRLPTEAEWEYCCRGGTTTAFSFGPKFDPVKANCWEDLEKTGGSRSTLSIESVKQFRPNKFGLYDMHGNVWEWCLDWYDKDYYSRSPTINPSGPRSGTMKVKRGGCAGNSYVQCTSGARYWGEQDESVSTGLGFRVVCLLE